MFIRRCKTGVATSGAAYFTYRLVESQRHGTKVQQHALLNLGRHFSIEPHYWRPLCARVEAQLAGRRWLLARPLPLHVEQEAQHIVARLIARNSTQVSSDASNGPNFQGVDVDAFTNFHSHTAGVEHVALWAMDRLGLRSLLEQLGLTRLMRAAIIGSIVGRMAKPGSERATNYWLRERVPSVNYLMWTSSSSATACCIVHRIS